MTIKEHIAHALAGVEHPVIVEIGAARGDDTDWIWSVSAALGKPEYFAFEPDPRNLSDIRWSDVGKRINVIAAAVSNVTGTSVFHQCFEQGNPGRTLSGSLKVPVHHIRDFPAITFSDLPCVRTMRLDDFAHLYSITHTDFVWCDVQGAEDLVLDGALEFLKTCRYWYTEYYDHEMYHGQIPLSEIARRLQGWSLVEKWEFDALFRNDSL